MSKPVTWRTQAEEITAARETARKDPEVRDKVNPDKDAGAKAIFPEPKHEPIPTEKSRDLGRDKADNRADQATDLKTGPDSADQDREPLRHRSLSKKTRLKQIKKLTRPKKKYTTRKTRKTNFLKSVF